MKKNVFFTFFTFFLFAVLTGCRSEKSAPQPHWAVLPDDAGLRMLAYASDFVSIFPRDSGSPGAGRASRWLTQEITRMGASPIVDCWMENTAYGKKAFCNVYVDFPGTSGQTIVLLSHYDTKAGIPNFQGANDGGSSTGVLLGLIEHFLENPPTLRDTIRVAFVDGEESHGPTYRDNDGLHGSMHLAKSYREQASKDGVPPVLCAIVIDMVGDKNLSINIPRNVTPWLGRIALRTSKAREKDCPPVSIAGTAIIDDHIPFTLEGFSAIDLIDFEYGSAPGRHDYWHTEKDSIDKLSAASLHKTGSLVLGMLERIEVGEEVPAELRRAANAGTHAGAQTK